MSAPPARRWARRAFGPAYAALVVSGLALAAQGSLPWATAVVIAVGGPTLASGLRASSPLTVRFLALFPALAGIGVLAAYCSLSPVAGLAGGLAGLALLFWCAEEPDRRAGALGRGAVLIALPAAGFGIAWTSSFLLPPGLGTVGIAAGLLAASAAAAVLLLRSPGTFDRDPAATS